MAGEAAEPPARPMKYPYTYTAKIAQFPWRMYWEKSWLARYYVFALFVSAPLFYKIGKMANSPENVAKWAEAKCKEAAEHGH